MSCVWKRISSTCRQARARVPKSDAGQVGEMPLPPHLNQVFPRSLFEFGELLLCGVPPESQSCGVEVNWQTL